MPLGHLPHRTPPDLGRPRRHADVRVGILGRSTTPATTIRTRPPRTAPQFPRSPVADQLAELSRIRCRKTSSSPWASPLRLGSSWRWVDARRAHDGDRRKRPAEAGRPGAPGAARSRLHPVGCANSDVSRELGFQDAGVGTVALLLPLLRKPGAVETRLPHAVPLHPAARPARPRESRQGPGDPRPASPTHRAPPPSPTSQAPTRRPSPARRGQPRAAPTPVVVLLRPARDAVGLASAAGRRRVDLPAPPHRPAAAEPRGAAADRPPGQGEPDLGLPTER
jgi:hypothetical protein